MILLEFGLGGFVQSFFLSLERKIFVSFMKDKNIDKFHFAVYILIFDPSPVLWYSDFIASASGANPLYLHHRHSCF